MGKLQELIDEATRDVSPVSFGYSQSLPEGIAPRCGPEEVADLITSLDQLSVARDEHEAGENSADCGVSDDIWRSQMRYASLLPSLISRFPQQVAAGLGSPHSSTRFWIALALKNFPTREAIPLLAKALEQEISDLDRQVLKDAARSCEAAR